MKTIIIKLINGSSNVGDDNAATAICRTTQEILGNKKAEIEECNINNLQKLEELREKALSGQEIIVVGCGSHMVEHLKNFKSVAPDNVKTCFASHQIPDNLLPNLGFLDSVAVPEYAISEKNREQLEDKLIATSGVAHNLTEEELEMEFKEFLKAKLIATIGVNHNLTEEELERELEKFIAAEQLAAPKKGLVLVLGGDAELPQTIPKQYICYSEEEARQLARFAIKEAMEGNFIYATNGPRTGMIDPVDRCSNLYTHRLIHPVTNEEINYKLDPVSQAFIDELQKGGLVEGKNFQFYDFKFLEKGVDSAYKALLRIAKKSEGKFKIVLPGESSSMISESDILPNGSVIVYRNNAMNENHEKQVKTSLDQGSVLLLDLEKMEVQSLKTQDGIPQSVAKTIANRLASIPRPNIAEAKAEAVAASFVELNVVRQ
ncbi:MAG: hypothetical protein K0R25_163 [Rickettsiaceae bacterium]|jgi:hypothetical protein|nr:hypothetical protein [Rickettsiaceae bacterium]